MKPNANWPQSAKARAVCRLDKSNILFSFTQTRTMICGTRLRGQKLSRQAGYLRRSATAFLGLVLADRLGKCVGRRYAGTLGAGKLPWKIEGCDTETPPFLRKISGRGHRCSRELFGRRGRMRAMEGQRWGIYRGHLWGQQRPCICRGSNGVYIAHYCPYIWPIHARIHGHYCSYVWPIHTRIHSHYCPHIYVAIAAPTYGPFLHIPGRCCPHTWPLLPLHIHGCCCPPIATHDYYAPASPEKLAAALLRCPRPLTG